MKVQMRTIILLAAIWSATVITNAQVTIGSSQAPNTNALLELTQGAITTKGLLLPRVELTATSAPAPLTAHVQGMHVYNTATAGTGATAVTPGEYYNDGTKWIKINDKTSPLWFYAPSMDLDLSTAGQHTIDLWDEYDKHFDGTGSRVINSLNAPQQPDIKRFQRRELYYYVTGYDATFFPLLPGNIPPISIDEDGVMTYTVADPSLFSDATYLNIIFVVK